MDNFIFYNPCRIIFGKGEEERVGEYVKKYSDNILLVYGKNHIKSTGLYDVVTKSLNNAKITYSELSGVEANPKLDLVYKGIEICKKKNIGFVLAVGGGSVIDTAKAVGVGACSDKDIWEILQRFEKAESTIPVGTILTAVGAGSEMSNSCVVTNEEKLKRSFDNEIIIPVFSILNPELTYSVSPFQTAVGSYDAMSHLMERYFTQTLHTDTTDRMIEGLLKVLMKNVKIVLKDPTNYDARAELMWSASLAQNGLMNTGSVGDWACHGIEHELSGEYDIAHGEGLAMITSTWMRYVAKAKPTRFVQFAQRIFNVDYPMDDEQLIIEEGIHRLEEFILSIGLPIRTTRLSIDSETAERLTDQALYRTPTKGRFLKLEKEDIYNIIMLAGKD